MQRTLGLLTVVFTLATIETALAQPGVTTEQHKVLKNEVGDWEAEMKLYPQGPDGPTIDGKCEETSRVLNNGMWLISDFKGDFAGFPFEGHGAFGYNPQKKKYVGTWVDNMNPALTLMEGDYDAKAKTLTMYSEGTDPETGKPMKTKNVTQYLEDGRRIFTMSNQAPGSDKYIKMMELTYTKKKGK